LLDKNCVQQRSDGENQFDVKSTDTTHVVQLTSDGIKCTCHWYAKHQNRRGPCKHILAVQMHLNQRESAT
ncbi:MAG: SWIM zinc finger family protein, partial [Planctomycetota bacterium]